MRVVQVGANTGDNANDHLVNFLKSRVAQGVLLEPVPWIFRALSKTYDRFSSSVQLINAAMSETVGNISFVAPNEKARGWFPQMGGINLPPKSLRSIKSKGKLNLFDKITVKSVTFESLLRSVRWESHVPDVFVVDAEGYDAVIVRMVLSSVQRLWGEESRIPILQFEWKHLLRAVREELWETLRRLGYCITQVHYDDIAVHTASFSRDLQRMECSASFELVM
jgi:FkbM family methyltransferase